MKNIRFLFVLLGLISIMSSCKAWNNVFGPKYGCPSNGKNIGAEKLASGDPAAEKSARKARKFRS